MATTAVLSRMSFLRVPDVARRMARSSGQPWARGFRSGYAVLGSDSGILPVFDVTNENFEADVMKSSVPVVLDCYADWCGPCRSLTPLLVDAVEKTDGKVRLAKLNTDDLPELAQALKVQSLPTVYGLHAGQLVSHFMGLVPESQLDEFMGKMLDAAEEGDGEKTE